MHVRRRLALVLVLGAVSTGMFGVTAGGADGTAIDPAVVSVDAETVADGGYAYEETAVMTLPNGTAGDRITVGAQPPADTEPLNVTVDGPVNVTQSNTTQTTLALNNSIDNGTVQVTVEQRLNSTLAGEAVAFDDRPTVTVVDDETGSDLDGQALTQVSIIAQQTIADFELVDPHGQNDPLEIPVDEAGTLTITNVTDEYGNQIYEDNSSGEPETEVDINITNDNPLIEEKTVNTKIESAKTEVELAKIDEIDLSIDQYEIGAKIKDEEVTEENIYRESNCIGFSNSTRIEYPRGFNANSSGNILIDFGIEDELINEFKIDLKDNTEEQNKEYIIESGDIEENVSTGKGEVVEIAAASPFGSAVTEDGTYEITVSSADPGNYTLDIDVMPELDAAADTTTESIPLRVHGPIASGSVTVNRTLLGTVVDPEPVAVEVEELRDDAGVLVADPTATVTNVTIGDTPVTTPQAPVSGPEVTLDGIDPTGLQPPTNNATQLPVTVQLDCNTTVTTADAVSLVHETHPLDSDDAWAPVSAPMAVAELQYATQNGTPAPDAVTVGWNATAESYERIDPTAHTRPQAWYVTGADRVGIVYNTTATPEPHTYRAGWHHVGPVMNLSDTEQAPLDTAFDGLDQAMVYDGTTPVSATTDAHAYETYWINASTPVEATVPGTYQPANRSTTAP